MTETANRVVVTYDTLDSRGACHSGMKEFARKFPDGIDISGLWGTIGEANRVWDMLFSDDFLRYQIGWAIGAGILPARIYEVPTKQLAYINLSGANMHRASLIKVDLYSAILMGVQLSGANLSGAVLAHADMRRANLYLANLFGADLSEAILCGADLSGANLYKANLHHADLSGANLHAADLRGADLSKSKLTGANFGSANLGGASLLGAKTAGARFNGAVLDDNQLEDTFRG